MPKIYKVIFKKQNEFFMKKKS